MKKFLLAGVGAVVLSTAMFLSLSDASRYKYYLQMRQQGSERHFTGRRGPWRYRTPSRHNLINHRAYNFSHPSRRHDAWLYRPYRVPQSPQVSVRRLDRPKLPTDDRFTASAAGTYRLNVPSGFTKGADGTYRSRRSTLAFRVVRTPGAYRCEQVSFEFCAINLGKEFKDRQSLVQSGRSERVTRWSQTRGRSFSYYPTMTESFHASVYGMENVYYVFNALNPYDGSVTRIEAVALAQEGAKTARFAKRLFQSFQYIR